MALTDNLIAHWNLADNAASTTVVAQVGTNGTLAGGDNTSVKHATGPNAAIPDAFDTNGSDDEVDISGSSISFASGTACSFRALCNFDQTTGNIFGIPSSTNGRIVKVSDTAIAIGPAVSFTLASMGTTNWCDVVFTRNASNSGNVYLNGTVSSSGAQTLAITMAPTRIGHGNVGFFDGMLASISVWSRELSASEVTQLYNGGSWLAYPWSSAVPVFMNQYRQRVA